MDVDPVRPDAHLGIAVGERVARRPVRGRLVAVEQTGGGEEPGAGADRRDPRRPRRDRGEVGEEAPVETRRPGAFAAHDHERVDPVARPGQGRQGHVGGDGHAALRADRLAVRGRDHGLVRRRGPETGGGAQHFDGAGEVEQLEAVEGHDGDVVGGGGGGHGDIIEDPAVGSNVIFLMIPASSRTLDNGGVIARPEPGTIPDGPGVVPVQGRRGPGHLRRARPRACAAGCRTTSARPTSLPERTRQMVGDRRDASSGSRSATRSRRFFLEFNLIKQHRPRFNIRLKDDKSYPYLAVTLDEEWPRAMVHAGRRSARASATSGPTRTRTRSARRSTCCCARSRSARAPRPSSTATTASAGRASTRTSRSARRRASATIDARGVRRRSSTSCSTFLDGEHAPVLDRLDKQMHEAADALEFERAARLRDQIVSVRKAIERQQMVGAKEEDFDVIGIAEDPLEASVQVFFVRKGRVVGRKGLVVDKVEDLDTARARRPARSSSSTATPTGDRRARARSSCPVLPEDLDALRGVPRPRRAGRKVRVRVPQRGDKRELLETVTQQRGGGVRPPQAASARPTTTRVPGRCTRSRRRSTSPRRRCGSSASTSRTCRAPRSSASMVVMEDGLPKRSDYRRFKIRHQDGQDDFASMEEVLTRRFRRYLAASATKARAAGKRFAYPPNLLLVDGGKGQLGVAVRVLEELGLEDICGRVASRSGSRRCTVPGQSRAGAHPARLRGALPAAAGARRGAPLRDHVPPPAAGQEDDEVGARRRARARADPARRGCSRSSAR